MFLLRGEKLDWPLVRYLPAQVPNDDRLLLMYCFHFHNMHQAASPNSPGQWNGHALKRRWIIVDIFIDAFLNTLCYTAYSNETTHHCKRWLRDSSQWKIERLYKKNYKYDEWGPKTISNSTPCQHGSTLSQHLDVMCRWNGIVQTAYKLGRLSVINRLRVLIMLM